MDSYLKLFCVLGCFVIAVVTMAGCVVNENEDDNKALIQLVAGGADPVAARCALSGERVLCGMYLRYTQEKSPNPSK